MTNIGDWADISAGHSVPSSVGDMNMLGFRACLSASFVDPDYRAQFDEALRRNPNLITLDYIFLGGPGRGHTVQRQIAYYARAHRADLSCLDWEHDTYKRGKVVVDNGTMSFADVLRGLALARERGLNPGVYAQRSRLTHGVVDMLIDHKVPFIWLAAYDGLKPPDWLVAQCHRENVILFHQYTGTDLDRSHSVVGTVAQLRAIAGIDTVTKASTFKVETQPEHDMIIPAGTELFLLDQTSHYTTVQRDVALRVVAQSADGWSVLNDGGVLVTFHPKS